MKYISKGGDVEVLEKLKKQQGLLMRKLAALNSSETDDVPEGYECILLSLQTLETERDRVARLVERRTSRDSPYVMRTRRQLRNLYALTICTVAKMFANDVVSRSYVQDLIDLADEQEKSIRAMRIV